MNFYSCDKKVGLLNLLVKELIWENYKALINLKKDPKELSHFGEFANWYLSSKLNNYCSMQLNGFKYLCVCTKLEESET